MTAKKRPRKSVATAEVNSRGKPGRPGPGRPPEISEEKIAAVVQALRVGATARVAASFAGIDNDTYCRWLKEGARRRAKSPDPSDPYQRFSDLTGKAMATAELGYLTVIAEAARGRPGEPAVPEVRDEKGVLVSRGRSATPERVPVWQAAAWWLERRQWSEYSRRTIHMHEGDVPAGAPALSGGPGGVGVGITIYLPAEEPLVVPALPSSEPPPSDPAPAPPPPVASAPPPSVPAQVSPSAPPERIPLSIPRLPPGR